MDSPSLATSPETLLDSVLATGVAASGERPTVSEAQWLDAVLSASSPWHALALWTFRPGRRRALRTRRDFAQSINRLIADIDTVLNDQVNAILHHPRFQKFEAGWRGLRYLVEQAEGVENMHIRVIHVPWRELARDLDLAIEFDQSTFFKKIYSEEFGTAGGIPFTVLIGDYEIRHRVAPDHATDDVAALMAISSVCASAFSPFIAAAHPMMFGAESFEALERAPNLSRIFDQLDYLKWRTLRHTEDARFAALTAPRILMRLPYDGDSPEAPGFMFREDVAGPDRRKYLWGSAAWALGGVLIRAFAASKWFADIRGFERGMAEGGLVAGLPAESFRTDAPGVATKCSVEIMLTDRQEKELSDLGFIPLCHCHDTEFSVFYANQTIQKPRTYDDAAATVNARISAMLQYMLCSARFAHYLKVIARDKVGSFVEPKAFQKYLHSWLQQYVAPAAGSSAEQKAKFPLRQAAVQVREHPARPGHYLTDIHLWPHFQLDDLSANIKLVTEFAPGTAAS
jgi:type VI secretion system ImpC/EvpB family protein